MRVEVLCLGTELLQDKTNTNVNLIARKLSALGLSVARSVTVGDVRADILASLQEALRRSRVVLVSGGLGPTFDDLTRECASQAVRRPLLFSPAILSRIRRRFDSAGVAMPEENRRQAYVLKGAAPILNAQGTAPGQILSLGGKCLILLPGPPNELEPMLDGAVRSYLRRRFSKSKAATLVVHTFGEPESKIDELIRPVVEGPWGGRGLKVTFGILAHRSVIDVKATAESKSGAAVTRVLRGIRARLEAILGDRIYGYGDETMESAVGKLLRERKETLAAAESCTGGLISHKITDVAGSSGYFLQSVVAYSNASKARLLGVRPGTLARHGAVSAEAAREMAEGIRKRTASDWGLSVTGIAGPGGGSREKPVGLVYFGLAGRGGTVAARREFYGTRAQIKEKAALAALALLRRRLSAQDQVSPG